MANGDGESAMASGLRKALPKVRCEVVTLHNVDEVRTNHPHTVGYRTHLWPSNPTRQA